MSSKLRWVPKPGLTNAISKPFLRPIKLKSEDKNKFVVCCFYTHKSCYEAKADLVKSDCQNLGLDSYFVGYPDRGSWVRNCALKPWFIKHCLEFHKNKNILYVDADARIRKYPKLVETFKDDIGIHYLKNKELLSGTIILNNNLKTRDVINRWFKLQEKMPNEWDQRVFQQVLDKATDVTVAVIPGSYCQIFDTMAILGEPVIEHFQASRQFR